MKKFTLALGLGAILIAGTCNANSVEQINTNIANALSPIQNSNTKAQITFNGLETNMLHVEHASLNALFSKIGSNNTLKIKINDLTYKYGREPFVTLDGAVDLDFSKIYPQKERETFVSTISGLLFDWSKSMVGYHNKEAVVKRHITSFTKDENGNYTSIKAIIIAHANINKLPQKERMFVPATQLVFSYSINLKTGIKIHAFGGINPDTKAFDNIETELKTTIDLLQASDSIVFDKIKDMASQLDSFALELVELGILNEYLPFLNLNKKAA